MLIRWGPIVADGRGSVGGTTFSRNRYGAIAKGRVKPVNPNSTRQGVIRGLLSSVSPAWGNDASAVQRTQWEVFASNVTALNKLGEVINLTGHNQFVKSNIAALNAGLPQILDGPTVFTLPGADEASAGAASEGTQLLSVSFDDARAWVDEDNAGMIVQMGIPQDPQINFFNGPWRHAGVIEGNGTAAPTTPTTMAVPYPVAEGQIVYIRTKIIRADGRLSGWFQTVASVGA